MAKRVFRRDNDNSEINREVIKGYYILKYFNLFMNGYKFTNLNYQQNGKHDKRFLKSVFLNLYLLQKLVLP